MHLISEVVEGISAYFATLGHTGACHIDPDDGRTDETSTCAAACPQPNARHPRDRAKVFFPAGMSATRWRAGLRPGQEENVD